MGMGSISYEHNGKGFDAQLVDLNTANFKAQLTKMFATEHTETGIQKEEAERDIIED